MTGRHPYRDGRRLSLTSGPRHGPAPVVSRGAIHQCAQTVREALLTAALLTACIPSVAQPFVVDEYTSSQGLPNNLVKQVLQDGQGYVWIATDGGLVRFDGAALTSFTRENGLPSNLVKSLFQDSRNRLLAVTDHGIVEVVHHGATTRLLVFGAPQPPDSILHYPKTIYEDRNRQLWVADARGIVRFSDDGYRRYSLPQESWPQSFVRSYSIVDDGRGSLVAISERGNVFVLGNRDDEFLELEVPEDIVGTNVALNHSDGTTWVAGAYGVRSFVVTEEDSVSEWRVISTQPDVMDLLEVGDGRVLLGTASHGVMEVSEDDEFSESRSYVSLTSPVVHDISLDTDGNLFVSTDNGFAHIRKSFFERAAQFKSTAIQSTTSAPSGKIFGIEANMYFSVERGDEGLVRVPLFSASQGLTALATDGARHWAGASDGTLYLFRGDSLATFRSRTETAIASMTVDGVGDVWVVPWKGRHITRVSVDGTVRQYGPDEGITSPVNVVRYLDRDVYVGAEGESYLMKLDADADQFVDVSQPLTFSAPAGVSVNDLDRAPDGRLWLASDQGLLLYGSSEAVRLAGSHDQEIRAIANDRLGNIWVGTGRGIYRITEGQASRFNSDPGIANLTVHYRSIAIDGDQRPWVGHYGGISYWSRLPGEKLVTPQPVIVGLGVDETPISLDQSIVEVPYGSFMEADFVSITLPGGSVRYQSRIAGLDDAWGEPTDEGHIHFPRSASGRYIIEVRAQQEGRLWSAPAEVHVEVAVPWYRQWWALAAFLVVSAAGFWLLWQIHDGIRTAQLRSQNARLERLVTKRTKEITDQKRYLEETNAELKTVLEKNNEFLGIAAHDLRNPLTSLIGFSELLIDSVEDMTPEEYTEKSGEILPIIHRAASTMQGVIQDLLDSQLLERSDRKLKLEETNLTALTHMVVNLNAVASRRKSITLTFDPKEVYRTRVDGRSMQRVIDNLISNAVKYSPPASEVKIKLSHTGQSVRISVVDQGPGLTEEDRSRVFGKLQRLSAKPTGGEPSTGLGLYVAKGVTEMHGGSIGVSSMPGEGSEFWVEIPAPVLRKVA